MTDAYPTMEYLRRLAFSSGEIMRKYFDLENTRKWKEGDGEEFGSNETPLTAADSAINDMVLEHIARDFPDINAIGEEGGNDEVTGSRYTVVWDPIDGTHAFMVGSAVSSFCIAVLKDDTPISAIIYDPLSFRPRMWCAEQGKGAFVNGNRRVRVSNHTALNRAQICMVWWNGCRYNMHDIAGRFLTEGATVQNPVSLAYFGGLVASGLLDVAMFPGHNIWETAAMQCVVEEAGGLVTNMFGERVRFHEGDIQGCIVSNGAIHENILRVVRESQ